MLRHQDKIRLTPKEKESFDRLAGFQKTAPTNVDEFNQRLETAAELWAAGDTAEEKLASALARDLMLPSAAEGREPHRPGADSGSPTESPTVGEATKGQAPI